MRQLYIYLSFYLTATLAYGQSSNKNYIKSTTYTTESADPNSAIVGISYFDGLGRPEQQIQLKASTNGNSLVTKIEYDGFGRQVKEYLPVPYATNGEFVTPTSITGSHYQQNYAQSVWYSEKTIENSPLNRVMKQAAPGDDWAKDGGHEIEFEYAFNTGNEVRIYWVDTNGDIQKGNYSTVGNYYEEKTLYKTVTTDENGNKIYEFKDKYGRVVLKRSFVTELLTAGKPNPGEPPTTLSKQVDTYYVYDYFGNLLAVIPPLAAEKTNMNSSIQNELCYLYKYDDKNRLVEKKLPGKGKEYMVYDKQNRLVATQDANLEAEGKWLFTKYDKFGRVVYTGIVNNSLDRLDLQTFVDGFESNNETKTVQPFQNNGMQVFYSKTGFPTTDFSVLTINYYDNYDGLIQAGTVSIPQTVYGKAVRNGSSDVNNSLKGLPTASFVSTLPDNDSEMTFIFYDNKTRPIRNHKINHLGGFTIVDSKLNFTGMPEETTTEHKRDDTGEAVLLKDEFSYDHLLRLTKHTQSINGNPAKNLIAKNEYDAIGQLITKKVGGTQNGNDRWQEVNYKYNIRGWLTNINDIGIVLYGKDAMPPAADDDLFSFKINYNQLNNGGSQYAEPLYNGNIAQTLWRSGSDNVVRGYVYNYDELNRLLEAQFHKNDNNPFTGAYNESLAYDINGNITSLNRTTGDTLGLPIDMDELTYSYKDGNGNSNLLLNVTDAVSNQNMGGFKDGNTNPNLNDYEYDLNGNMILDRNKGITEITYNHLNLPEKITFSNNDYIVYTYNAAGQKLSKYIFMVNTNNTIKTVEYLDGFQYTGGQLNFFPHPEGFVDVTLDINSQRVFNYVFNYTDHLGNIRLSYTKDMVSNELKIMEETHYYPFGLKHEVYTSPIVLTHKATPEPNIVKPGYALETEYQYKYNGKEFQDELGLNMYAMDMRQYDPAIARWVVHDPIVHHSMSPYNAFDGNPVFWADPSGGEVYTPAQHEWNQKFENSIFDGNNGIDAFSAFNGNFWQFHPFDEKSGATEANGNQNRETDPPGKEGTKDNGDSEGENGCPKCPRFQKLAKQRGGNTDLQRFKDKAYSLKDWVEQYKDKSFNEIINEEPKKNGMPGGPSMRYVKNPYDGNVMDMRHVMIVGFYYGRATGDLVEIGQYIGGIMGNENMKSSAFDAQDYYSNDLGARFSNYRFSTLGFGFERRANNFAQSFSNWLNYDNK